MCPNKEPSLPILLGVIGTDLGRHMNKNLCFKCLQVPMSKLVFRTPNNGAQTTIWCALEDSIENQSGLYYADCAVKTPHRNALVQEDQKKLWELSEKMVGLRNDPDVAQE